MPSQTETPVRKSLWRVALLRRLRTVAISDLPEQLLREPGRTAMAKHAADIFDALKADHRKHRDLLKRLASTRGKSKERAALFTEFTLEAKGHAAAEEQALYSTLLRKPPTTDKGRHSVAEHKKIEDLLNALAATPMTTGGWLVRLRELRHYYLHHLEEEEKEIFPAADRVLAAADERFMRGVFRVRKVVEKARAEVTPKKKARK